MTTTIGTITLDGQFGDWPAADMIMTAANAVSGYQVYGALITDPTAGPNYVIGIDATVAGTVIGAGTVIYLNTDQSNTSGFSPFGGVNTVGAEYEVQFALDPTTNQLQAYLYSVTSAGVATQVSATPLSSGISVNGEGVELAIPQSMLTPSGGGAAPTAINFDALINNAIGLPTTFSSSVPEYIIPDPSVAPPAPQTIANLITLDGQFSDWPAADMIMRPGNTVAGYQVFGALLSDSTLGNTYVIGIDATPVAGTPDPVIGAGTTIYLNTDQNTATGFSPFGGVNTVGADYEVQFAYGSNATLQPYLYQITPAATAGVAPTLTLLNGGAPLEYGLSSDGESVEVAIPQSLLTPTGGTAPKSINFDVLINNGSAALPSDFTDTQYTITDPSTIVPVNTTVKKVAIIYSDTSAALYDGLPAAQAVTAYDDLFLAAQQQARAA